MKLGDIACVTVNSTDVQSSSSFYEKLGFRRAERNSADNESILFSDGILLLMLKATGEPHSALTYVTDDLDGKLKILEALDITFIRKQSNEANLIDPNGLAVRLLQAETSRMDQPQGTSWSGCGRFYEVSIETESVDSTIAFWEKLGFEVAYREPPTARWATLNDGNIKLGLYERGSCPHKFKNPSLTYFEPDMAERIERLKSEGVTFAEELRNGEGEVANAIAEAPDGQYFFLFFYDGEL